MTIIQTTEWGPMIYTFAVASVLGLLVIFDEELKRVWPWWRD